MSNSPLVEYTKLSPNHSGLRTSLITRITPHCVVGQCSVERIGQMFEDRKKQASSNYGIGTDGKIGMFVSENMRSWCSSSRDNDQKAVTIECASDNYPPYRFNDKVYKSLVNLCVDICRRNSKSILIWIDDKDRALSYKPGDAEMILTIHRWFAAKSCPGDWLYNRLGDLAREVTRSLNPAPKPTIYRVQVGAFLKKPNAEKLRDRLKQAGFEDAYIVEN